MHVTNTESNSKEFIYQAEEPEGSNSDKENMGGNIKKSSTSSPLEVIPVTTEFTDVFPKDSTLITLKVTLVTTEFTDVFLKDNTLFLSKLPL